MEVTCVAGAALWLVAAARGAEPVRWWKGNLHTHTLWSDGDHFPEVATQWYYEHGYHFLALSDHNTLLRGQRWINPETNSFAQRGGGMDVYELYRERFGDDWIETRQVDGQMEVRLKPLHEVRALFEEAGRFIMIDSEEITEGRHVVHVNATNILEFIEPQTGETVEETVANTRGDVRGPRHRHSSSAAVPVPACSRYTRRVASVCSRMRRAALSGSPLAMASMMCRYRSRVAKFCCA